MNLTSFLGHFLLFWAPMGSFWGRGRVHKLIWGLLMLLSNFHFLRFLQFGLLEFDLILGIFFTFWSHNGLLLGLLSGSTTVLGSIHVSEHLSFSLFLTFGFAMRQGEHSHDTRRTHIHIMENIDKSSTKLFWHEN